LLELEVTIAVSKLEEKALRELASYFKISFIGEYDQPKPIGQIRTDMMLAAKRNPEGVKKVMGSDAVTTQYRIKQAIVDRKIDLGSTPGSALWATGAMISQIPSGRAPLDFLTDLALSVTDEGKKFKEQLRNI
jgi:hypothetical protein